MFSVKRNQVIITALVAMIAVAGYLNWQDAQEQQPFAQAIALDDHGQIMSFYELDPDYIVYGDEFYSVFDTPWIASDFDYSYDYHDPWAYSPWVADQWTTDVQSPVEPGEAVFVSAQDTPAYFIQARLEREQSRARQTDILMNMMGDMQGNTEQVSIITDAMLEIQRRIERETAAEAMIESKGFREVYVRIGDQYVDVVVNRETLSDAEVAQIEDIVRRKTGMATTQIRISPRRQ